MHPQAHNELRRPAMSALNDEALLNSAQVKAQVGNVTDMCIWRWMRDERVQFPLPVQINRRNYWKLGDIRAWQAKQTKKSAA